MLSENFSLKVAKCCFGVRRRLQNCDSISSCIKHSCGTLLQLFVFNSYSVE